MLYKISNVLFATYDLQCVVSDVKLVMIQYYNMQCNQSILRYVSCAESGQMCGAVQCTTLQIII